MPSELQQRFPNLTPIKSPPSLHTVNGIGFGLWGKRDYDSTTETYIATWCFVVVFLPILCLRAYRVAKAPGGGWYFLGREPMSPMAKGWNLLLPCIAVGIIGLVQYNARINSPEYRAKQQMVAAQKLVGDGKLAAGARTYAMLVTTNTPERGHAQVALRELLDAECKQAPLSEAAGVYPQAVVAARRGGAGAATTDQVAEKGVKLVAAKGDADPKSGVAILDAVRPLVIDTAPLDERRLALLHKWAAAEPNNLDVIVPLAAAPVKKDQVADAKKLLLPLRDQLGDGEGARALGLILAREGDYDGAYSLLWPNVKRRLDRLRSVEAEANGTEQRIWDREVARLDKSDGPSDFFQRYEGAGPAQKKALVQEYIGNKIRNDPDFTASQAAMEKEMGVVGDALELGIVMLQRAQTQQDTVERTKQLKAAEETFLAIHGFAGETDAYRLTLGQVYYWLGRQADGKKQFDDFLASKNRGPADLLQIAGRLRQLGADDDVRTLSEEAYNKASTSEERYAAAHTRAVVAKDNDDRIGWLNRSNLAVPTVKATLARAVGEKAFEEGRDEEAVRQYNEALALYESMPRSETALNETALTHFAIYSVTGDPQAYSRCLDCFQQAVEKDPSDSVLLFNAGITLLGGASADIIGQAIDLKALRADGALSLLDYLYRDDTGRDAFAKRVAAHAGMARSLGYLEKLQVLAPKSVRSYTPAYSVHRFTRNEPALRSLLDRLRAAAPEAKEQLADRMDFINGAKDADDVKRLNTALQRGESRLAPARAKGGAAAAIALTQQVETMLSLQSHGQSVDLSAALALADEADKALPSTVTWRAVVQTRLTRAYVGLCQSDPGFAAFCKPYERPLGVFYLMGYLAGESNPHQSTALAHPDVKAALALEQAQAKTYPDGLGTFDWALLSIAAPADAQRVAASLKRDTWLPVTLEIDQMLQPSSATEALDAVWFTRATGTETSGKEGLARVAAMGIAVPPVK